MWTQVSIPGSPQILMVDGTRNIEGWERDFFGRLRQSLQRSELAVDSHEVAAPSELSGALQKSTFNCLLLFAHAESDQSSLRAFWETLRLQKYLPPFLFAICSPPEFDAEVNNEVLKSPSSLVPLAVAPQSPMSAREAGLFHLKFFTELKLHSAENISGKMVWFSFSKAKELLRRRRYSGKFGVRC
jgi:hypothetical protein